MKTGQKFVWTELQHELFEFLKYTLCDQVMLSAPRGNE